TYIATSRFSALLRFNSVLRSFVFFLNDTATTEIYTLSLHDALPISILKKVLSYSKAEECEVSLNGSEGGNIRYALNAVKAYRIRSEEHTSELQSRSELVCRHLLEKKKRPDLSQSR